MTERCHACGKAGCAGKDDPVGGPYSLHNAAAYAALLEREPRGPVDLGDTARMEKRRVVLDTNAVDSMAAQPEAYDAIRKAVDDGRLDVMWTHITVDELAAIPDATRRAGLLTLGCSVARMVATGAAVFDYSRFGLCRLTEDPEAIDAFRRGNMRHTRDALIASTAEFEQCPLVTDDKQLTARAEQRGVQVLTVAALAEQLREPA